MKMTFGKFKGIELKEIKKSYLSWLLTIDLQDDLKAEIESILNPSIESKIEVEDINIYFNVTEAAIFIKVPYSLKSEFRKNFKTNAKWNARFKMWEVKNSTRNYNKMLKVGYVEVETFEFKEHEVKSYMSADTFIDYCDDQDIFDYASRKAAAVKLGFSGNLNF